MNTVSERNVETLHSPDFPSIREALLKWLLEQTRDWEGKTAIMAGHYNLFFRPETEELVPLVSHPSSNDGQISVQEKEWLKDVGDFPEATLELGLRFLKARKCPEDRIALLVNDQHFQDHQSRLPEKPKLLELMRAYYRKQPQLPESFSDCLLRHELGMEVFERNDGKREKDSTLPSHSICFSERTLQNRFLRHRKKAILKLPGFHETSAVWSRRLLYQSQCRPSTLCLANLDRHDCGCSGTMLEFLMQLCEKGARNLVLFIPEPCNPDVHGAVEAALKSHLIRIDRVISVWGGKVTAGKVHLKGGTAFKASTQEGKSL